jgi:hypothetical protein
MGAALLLAAGTATAGAVDAQSVRDPEVLLQQVGSLGHSAAHAHAATSLLPLDGAATLIGRVRIGGTGHPGRASTVQLRLAVVGTEADILLRTFELVLLDGRKLVRCRIGATVVRRHRAQLGSVGRLSLAFERVRHGCLILLRAR